MYSEDPVELEIAQELAIQAMLLEKLKKQDERQIELIKSIKELKMKLQK
jgi:uncharacterized protein YjaG (DUF416 family)